MSRRATLKDIPPGKYLMRMVSVREKSGRVVANLEILCPTCKRPWGPMMKNVDTGFSAGRRKNGRARTRS